MSKAAAKARSRGWSVVSAKNQVTIPAEVRNATGIGPGVGISFTHLPDGRIVLRHKSGDLRDLRGALVRGTTSKKPVGGSGKK